MRRGSQGRRGLISREPRSPTIKIKKNEILKGN